MLDLMAFPLDEALDILKKHNINYITVETKAPFVYNNTVPTRDWYVVKQTVDESGIYTLYITNKLLKGGAQNGL